MLEIFRKKIRGIMTIGILSIIVLAFAFWGLGDYFHMSGGQNVAAVVDGKKITWQNIDTVYRRLHRHFGHEANERALKEQLRVALVQRIALLSAAESLGFQVGDVQLGEALIQMPAFQKEGKFSKERYLEVLRQVGYQDAEFRKELSQDLLIAQLEQGISQSNFSLESELVRLVSLLDQKRDFHYALLSSKDYRKDIQISSEDIQAYYDAHRTQYISPEKVALEYVQLSLDELAKPIEVSDDVLKSHYEEHAALYTAPESIHAKHILITVRGQNAKEADAKAQEKINQILAEIKQGADFNTLAKQHSQDEGSAQNGGDLGWFTRGQMVPEFEQAAFALKPDELSDPVRSQFGYHIIQVMDRKEKNQRSFDEVKNLVKEQYQREKAMLVFSNKLEEMDKLSHEHSEALEPLAKALNLKIETTDLFSRKGGKDDLTKNPALINAAFSEALISQKHNSAPVKINESTAIVLRIKEHKSAEQETREQVEQKIVDALTGERAILKAKEIGEQVARALKQNPGDKEKLTQEHHLNWVEKQDASRTIEVDSNLLSSAFQAKYPEGDKPSIESVSLPLGDYAIIMVTKVHPGSLEKVDSETQIGYKKGLSEILSQIEFGLYANQVYARAKAEFPNTPKQQTQTQ